MRFIIIGNGIIALATAFRLAGTAKSGDKIIVIGKPAREGSASLAAAAMLNSFAEIEAGSLDTDLDRYRFELSRKAGAMWPAFEQEILAAEGKGRKAGELGLDFGTYIINNTAADDLDDENYDAIIKALEEYKEPHKPVDPHDIPNYMPEQRYRATRALLIENEGWLNPRLLLAGLDAALANFPQVEFTHANAERILAANGKVTGVVLDNSKTIEGDNYLLATGATAGDLLAKSDIGVKMQRVFYGVGVSLELRSPDHLHKNCVRTPNRGLACGVYSAPYYQGANEKNDHILIGASNFITAAPYNYGRLGSIETLTTAAIEQINAYFFRADLVRVNIGWRPSSQDTYPLLGKTSLGNLVVATGTKRDGLHLSPLLSEMMATLLKGGSLDARMDVFAPERRPHITLTRELAIDKAVRHQISAAYQHGYSPAKSRMPENVIQMHRDALEKLHDQVGAHDWGIPPEMLDMYRYGHAKI